MRRIWFWLRWSGRDLRRRWVQVTVIALIIALGTGVQAGLGSTSDWRKRSYDESYALLHMHDLRASLEAGSYVQAGALRQALAKIPHPEWVVRAEERLIVPTQVDASTGSRAILVPGRVVGVEVSDGGPVVDGIHVTDGRALRPSDDGRPMAVLEAHFASHYDLPASGRIVLPGDVPLGYVGAGYSPEHYMVVNEASGFSFMAEANYAVVFVPLATAQRLAGQRGRVNDLVLTLADGVSLGAARREVATALRVALPDVGTEVSTRDEDTSYRLMYGDLDSDQGTFNLLAALMFVAAIFAAFNLTNRIVEAQRREIGIGMALGATRRAIAFRPLLVGAEIALLGVAFGVGVGLLVGAGMRAAMESVLPLPVWETPFRPGRFAGAAALGFLLPFLATAWPVWRAVRVQPVRAIRTGHLAVRGRGAARYLGPVRLPGGALAQLPVRNVLRAPRRTVLTALGIAAAIMALVGILGMLDSFDATIDRGDAELLRGAEDRVTIDLTGFQPTSSPVIRSIVGSAAVAEAEPTLKVGGTLQRGPMRFEVLIEVLPLGSAIWHPTVGSPTPAGDLPGVVIAAKAAADLGVHPGDTVQVGHPLRTGARTFSTTITLMRVVGVHSNPIRSLLYMDPSDAAVMRLVGVANSVQALPAPGRTTDDVKRSVFSIPGVASVQPVSVTAQTLRDAIEQMQGVLVVIELFALGLALLVALNTASINADERGREHATMFAFGMRLRTLLRMTALESLIVGLLGVALGLLAGAGALGALMSGATAEAPEVDLARRLAPATMLAAIGFGSLVALLAPLFTARRLRRMDVASMLRVIE